MRIASIDIGTNTILLLIADVNKDGIVKVVHDEQVIARLGKGVDENRIISQETFLRAKGFLVHYKEVCAAFSVDHIAAVGTSALRDARNNYEFISFIKDSIGITIEIFSGDDEAKWTYIGGISDFIGQSENFSVIDIGGGSSEIISGNSTQILSKVSLDIGSVRITERILKNSPPEISDLMKAHEFILSTIPSEQIKSIHSTFAIGVAGTLTTLAALHQQLPKYIPEKISGYVLSIDDIRSMFAVLKDKSLEQIVAFPQISSGRADIILAGIMILMGFMEKSGLKQITVSDRGLRFGIVLKEIDRFF
ncbi:MAG: Ppx/GppA phosphatase family protein [Bacteroidota bacterium]|nr:Ppx/GppA phosphatase family protein [Bacteroidota bacterium]